MEEEARLLARTPGSLLLGPGGQAAILPDGKVADDLPKIAPGPSEDTPRAPDQPAQRPIQVPIATTEAATSPVPTPTQPATHPTEAAPAPSPSPQTTQAKVVPPSPVTITTTTATPAQPSSSSMAVPVLSETVSSVVATTSTTEPSFTSDVALPSAGAVVVSGTSESMPSPTVGSTFSNTNASLTHSPPFYVGVVLGVVVVFAFIAATVAYCIRIRAQARRRRELEEAPVSWMPSDTLDDAPPFLKPDPSFVGSTANSVRSWQPTGERDVGEPRKTGTSTPISPTKPMSSANPFLDPYRSGMPESHGFPSANPSMPDPSHTFGPLQVANMLPGDMSVAGGSRPPTSLGTFGGNTLAGGFNTSGCIGDFGTPREAVAGFRPRFWALEGEGLDVPWQAPSVARRGSVLQGGSSGGDWQHLPASTPKPEMVDEESWTASIKLNLVNAFNAVANGIPLAGTPASNQDDNLTPAPIPRTRRSLKETREGWETYSGGPGEKGLTRESTRCSAWTLEEREDGAGVVHIRGLGLDTLEKPLTIGASICDEEEDETTTEKPSKPAAAVIREQGVLKVVSPSRESSVYSMR